VTSKYNKSIKVVEKLASLSFKIVWQGPQASQTLRLYWPRLSTLPTAGQCASAHAHNLPQYIGKCRQLHTHAAAAALISMQIDVDVDARCDDGVCALYNIELKLFLYPYLMYLMNNAVG
jgi:hypothetical protein